MDVSIFPGEMMRVLVGCEESQEITKAFRARGHEAYSCDLKPCSGGHPEWHIQGPVECVTGHIHSVPVIADGKFLDRKPWDLFIVHPECTHLAVSGARWFGEKLAEQKKAIDFFMTMVNAPISRIAIENPIGIMSTLYRKPDQYIQPYEYGHDASKKTCLWLKNLPPLKKDPAKYIEPRIVNGKPRWGNQTDSGQNRLGPSPERSALRAKTYTGWARAMADQWGCL